jgi:hypothetical protein
MKAYNIQVLTQPADRSLGNCQGWCFGLPPGITSEQWPLDPNNGYPLMHGFTLLLPPDYRVHGPDIVAFSFFATSHDYNDGGPTEVPQVAALFAAQASMPTDPRLLPFWQAAQLQDSQLFRMDDILGCAYAVRLLTQAEFDGPLRLPPELTGLTGAEHPFSSQCPPPKWMCDGSARSYWLSIFPDEESLDKYPLGPPAGKAYPPGLQFNRALQWTPRAMDPNAGVPPREYDEDGGYQMHYYWLDDKIESEYYREHEWAKGHDDYHIGGTMRPIQAMPQFSPFYVGFDEAMGGYNFGGGSAQLDFKDMKFDWACG